MKASFYHAQKLFNYDTYNDEKKDNKKDDGEAKVEPVRPPEQMGGKKKGLLDTCK
jgi:hypothetical protein